MSPVVAYIGAGANLGFARDAVLNALADLSRLPKSEFVAASSLYLSAPIGGDGPDYVNAVAEIETELTARELLAALQAIELRYGRVRTTRNAPRTLDLDLLIYGNTVSNEPDLMLPHPRLAERAFVLRPLLEIAPDIAIPGRGAASDFLPLISDQRIERVES